MQRSRPSRYQALADYLARRGGPTVVLTDTEIEAIIGARLPLAASLTLDWWTNPAHIQVRMLRERGWRAGPERDRRQVRFTRDEE